MEILQKLRELQRQEGELGEAEERGTQVCYTLHVTPFSFPYSFKYMGPRWRNAAPQCKDQGLMIAILADSCV